MPALISFSASECIRACARNFLHVMVRMSKRRYSLAKRGKESGPSQLTMGFKVF